MKLDDKYTCYFIDDQGTTYPAECTIQEEVDFAEFFKKENPWITPYLIYAYRTVFQFNTTFDCKTTIVACGIDEDNKPFKYIKFRPVDIVPGDSKTVDWSTEVLCTYKHKEHRVYVGGTINPNDYK